MTTRATPSSVTSARLPCAGNKPGDSELRPSENIADPDGSTSNVVSFSDALKVHHEAERVQAVRRILRMSDNIAD